MRATAHRALGEVIVPERAPLVTPARDRNVSVISSRQTRPVHSLVMAHVVNWLDTIRSWPDSAYNIPMSSLSTKDKLYLEKLFQMSSGYVLDFTNYTMKEFFRDNLDINIYDEAYKYGSGSKANCMRGFWKVADDSLVGKSIVELIAYIESQLLLDALKLDDFKPALMEQCRRIGERLVESSPRSAGDAADTAKAAAFLEEEFTDVNVAIGHLETDIRDVIKQRISEIEATLSTAPLASILLIGSTLEGILLDVAKRHATQFVAAKAAPTYKGKVLQVESWKLNDLINVGCELGFVTRNVKDFSHSLREFRNYIHPRAQASFGFYPDASTARICFQVLKAAITEVNARTTRLAADSV